MVRMPWTTRERQCHANDQPSAVDLLGFEKYVRAARKHLTDPNTAPPLTLSVEAEWGGGVGRPALEAPQARAPRQSGARLARSLGSGHCGDWGNALC